MESVYHGPSNKLCVLPPLFFIYIANRGEYRLWRDCAAELRVGAGTRRSTANDYAGPSRGSTRQQRHIRGSRYGTQGLHSTAGPYPAGFALDGVRYSQRYHWQYSECGLWPGDMRSRYACTRNCNCHGDQQPRRHDLGYSNPDVQLSKERLQESKSA